MDQRFEQTAFYPADILLPQTADMKKWPVVACDQFTSQPDYWQAAEAVVGEAPSALRLVLPEVYLNGPDVDKRIETINASMDRYLAEALFRTLPDSLIYLERTQSDGRVRHGLIGCVDLEQYDFTPGLRGADPGHGGDGAGAHPTPGTGAGARGAGTAPCDAADRRSTEKRDRTADRGDRRHGGPL